MNGFFSDRAEAGQRLAHELGQYVGRPDVLVLALPPGGVPVARAVARALQAPLDVLMVRKLGVPGHEQLAMGAITTGGLEFRDKSVVSAFEISRERFDAAVRRERAELVRRERAELVRRERAYRGDRPFPSLRGQTVILVDDGIGADSPVRAALRALQLKHAAAIVIATPVATGQIVQALRREVADVVTVLTPEHLLAVAEFYDNFQPPTDEEVRELLAQPDLQPDDLAVSLR